MASWPNPKCIDLMRLDKVGLKKVGKIVQSSNRTRGISRKVVEFLQENEKSQSMTQEQSILGVKLQNVQAAWKSSGFNFQFESQYSFRDSRSASP